jgi:hypothetical protein
VSFRLLYVPSGHPLQEADDCLMWDRLGIQWLSTGYYSRSSKPGDLPELHAPLLPELGEQLERQYSDTFPSDHPDTFCGIKNKAWTGQVVRNMWIFDEAFARKFDAVLFSHFPENARENVKTFRGRPVCLKTYGMHAGHQELEIKTARREGIKVIRNNPKEHMTYGQTYAGHDAIIRGSVVRDEDELSGWTGEVLRACTFSSGFDYAMRERTVVYEAVKKFVRYPCEIYGTMNDRYAGKDVFLGHEQKLRVLRQYRVNLVVGTPMSTNTYSMVEAWVMGQPIVAFGPNLWQSPACEVPDLIENGVDGFYSDDLRQLGRYVVTLMRSPKVAQAVSEAARKKAVAIYGRAVLAEQWRAFFKNQGLRA